MIIKPTRKKAYSIILSLRESLGPEHADDLESLINYFAPAVPKNPKTAFEWVAAAAGKSDVRFYLNYVYVENGRMVATDGARLHLAKTDLANGFYDPKTGRIAKVDAKYPDIERVIPKTGTMKEASTEKILTEVRGSVVPSRVKIVAPGVQIDESYFLQAKVEEKIFYSGEWQTAIVSGGNEFGTFVIMGLRR